MKNFRVFIEKDDTWLELGIFSATTGEKAVELALRSMAILDFYTVEELAYVNLEYQELQ